MERFRTTLAVYDEPVDCRDLIMTFRFYELTEDQCKALASRTSSFLLELFRDRIYARWNHAGKCRHGTTALFKELAEQGCMDFHFEGFVKSPQVFDRRTFSEWRKFMLYDHQTPPHSIRGVSMDYPAQWVKLFPCGRPTDMEIEEAIYQLFEMQGRKCVAIYHDFEIRGIFCASPYQKMPDKFYGSFDLSVSAYCLGDQLTDFSQRFLTYAEDIATTYHTINVQITLQPQGKDPYERYFRGMSGLDDSHIDAGRQPFEWYPSYYLHGIAWANIISPRTQTLLGSVDEEKMQGSLSYHLPGGALMVRSTKSIDRFDVEDARAIKKIIYSALKPGHLCIKLEWIFGKGDDTLPLGFTHFPRKDWAVLPLFRDEISVVASHLVFAHRMDS